MTEARTPRLPPGPRSRIPGRVAAIFARDRLGFLRDVARTHGDVVFFRNAGYPMAVLNHPDFVHDVLVARQHLFRKGVILQRSRILLGDGLLTSEGDYHRRQRHLLQPAFHRERLLGYAATMVACALEREASWTDGATVDVAVEMAAITVAAAGRTLFGADVGAEAIQIREALSDALASFTIALLPMAERLVRLPLPPAIRFRRARARLDATVYRLIDARRREGIDRGDLLSTLVFAHDEDGRAAFTDEQIRDEVITMLLAGHETATNALAWTWYLLSGHAAVERRLHEEVDEVLADGPPTSAALPRLPYTRAVVVPRNAQLAKTTDGPYSFLRSEMSLAHESRKGAPRFNGCSPPHNDSLELATQPTALGCVGLPATEGNDGTRVPECHSILVAISRECRDCHLERHMRPARPPKGSWKLTGPFSHQARRDERRVIVIFINRERDNLRDRPLTIAGDDLFAGSDLLQVLGEPISKVRDVRARMAAIFSVVVAESTGGFG